MLSADLDHRPLPGTCVAHSNLSGSARSSSVSASARAVSRGSARPAVASAEGLLQALALKLDDRQEILRQLRRVPQRQGPSLSVSLARWPLSGGRPAYQEADSTSTCSLIRSDATDSIVTLESQAATPPCPAPCARRRVWTSASEFVLSDLQEIPVIRFSYGLCSRLVPIPAAAPEKQRTHRRAANLAEVGSFFSQTG